MTTLVVAGAAACSSGGSGGSAASPAPLTSPSSGGKLTGGASMRWADCGASSAHQQCARLAVPRNWSDPAEGSIILSLRRVRATDPEHRIGSLLINPGGPGESTLRDFSDLVSIVSTRTRARFDVVGFDPRGVGESAPIRCVNDATIDKLVGEDPLPTMPAAGSQFIKNDQTLAAACERNSGALLPYVGTRNVARDMDAIRAALGEPKLTYLGFSYGTLLGAMYADLFPNRVRALVLDGAVDPAQDPISGAIVQARGFQQSLQAFLNYCGAHRTSCPYPAGTAGRQDLDALLEQIQKAPMPTDLQRQLDIGEAYTGIAAALYDAKNGWPVLAKALQDADRKDDGTILLRLADLYNQRGSNGRYTNLLVANTAISCVDHVYPQQLSAYAAAARRAATVAPDFGAQNVWSLAVCAHWPAKATDPVRAPTSRQVAPALVIGSTGDPATPYSEAQALTRELGNAMLLTRVGQGHTAYAVSACVRNYADSYLIDQRLPPKGTRCSS